MILKAFSVMDVKAATYGNPFYSTNKLTAIREFSQAVNDKNTGFHKFPEDYVLFEVGEWDTSTGLFAPINPVSIGSALEFKQSLSQAA